MEHRMPVARRIENFSMFNRGIANRDGYEAPG